MTAPVSPDEIKQAAAKLQAHLAGYWATWTVDLGTRTGLLAALREVPDGLTSRELASRTGNDPLYVDVWCRNAFGAELLEQDGERYRLPPAVAVVLLDRDSPAYAAGSAQIFIALRDVMVDLRERMRTGERIWWDTAPREFVDGVAEGSRPFYTRLISFCEGRSDLRERLEDGATVLEVGIGYGAGLIRLAERFPKARFIGTDGDGYSVEQARRQLAPHGDRVRVVHATFEGYAEREVADIAFINISLHEARDIGRAVSSMRDALRDGGVLLVSDFPYPTDASALRTVPGRVMSGIQYFEASIDDQLLPTAAYVKLLADAGLREVEVVELTPMHAVVLGRR